MSEEITQWEYKTVLSGDMCDKNLSELGNQGWELSGERNNMGSTNYFYFKRPKPKQKQPSYDGYSR